MQTRQPAAEHIELLRERSAALARPLERVAAARTFPAVVFSLGRERYALDARRVLEVVVLRDLLPLPGARAPMFGLTHWRGRIVAVLDLRDALGVRIEGVTDLSRLIVVDAARPFGVLADAARELVDIDPRQIRSLDRADDVSGGLVAGTTAETLLVIDVNELIGRFAGRTADTQR